MPETSIQDKAKDAAGKAAAELVQNGMTLGLGTGTTVAYFIHWLSIRCKKGLNITAIATSTRTAELAQKNKIPLLDPALVTRIDLAVDGADEIDHQKQMIKGGGGALLREKIVAAMADSTAIIIDEKKYVKSLGAFPLPVEIAPFGFNATLEHLKSAGFKPHIRMNEADKIFITDNGNYIADLRLKQNIENLELLDQKIKRIPGVLETGLFINLAKTVIIGHFDGKITTL